MTDTKMFQFAQLQGFESGKPFDGMAQGRFIDMWGRETVLEHLDEYAVNTMQLLESTRDANGQIVGLPIDAMGHDGREAAGWIVDVQLSDPGKIQFTPRWNYIGQDLIRRDIVRFFSPTINTTDKVILGGSLTNWPATRTAKEILLKPVELSMDIMQIDAVKEAGLFARFMQWITGQPEKPQEEPMENIDTPGAPVETPEPLESPTMLELAQAAKLEAMIEERANLKLEAKLAEVERKNAISSYASAAQDKGLPVQSDELSAFLLSLTPESEAQARAILDKVLAVGVIDFTEKGHAKVKQGVTKLSDPFAKILRSYLATPGATLEEFFTINADMLGNQSDYDLAEYISEEE